MKYILSTICFLVLSSAEMLEDTDYCSRRYHRLCYGKGMHIGCQFPDIGPGYDCVEYMQVEFTSQLKQFILHYINTKRQRLAAGNETVQGGEYLPKPRVMMLVEWDPELAFLAQKLADQCDFVHDSCRATIAYPYAGQSVGEVRHRGDAEFDILRAIRLVINAWWEEKRRARVEDIVTPFRLPFKGGTWGHFAQLAIWNLRALGCGAVRYGDNSSNFLLVCDFSHTNMLDQRTIELGLMERCPMDTQRSRSLYPLLCVSALQLMPVWKQSRHRSRPIVKALLAANAKGLALDVGIPLQNTLQHLDEEVRAQLYNDTGFKSK